MEYKFAEIFDIPALTKLCESFTRINGTVTALLDLEGNVHIATGWQDVCTKFHRVNVNTCARCKESDTALASKLAAGEKYNIYKCKNGLMDVAVPVMIEGQHVGNFFTGQFLYKEPEIKFFSKQAKEFGIDEVPYLEALKKVPVFREDDVKRSVDFLVHLTQVIGEMGKQKLDRLRAEELQRGALERLVGERTQELNDAKQKLEILASKDSLTGLYNRREFGRRLEIEFIRAKRYKKRLTIAMFDADFFKSINDKYGHAAGDKVLINFAQKLESSIRDSDIAARIGGEEFCLVFPESGSENIILLAERIRQEIAKEGYCSNDEHFNVTCSIGVACMDESCNDQNELLRHADVALYRAKENGRNQVQLFG